MMKLLVLAVMSLNLASPAFAQRRGSPYWSLGGFGNVLFPGTGHAPSTPPGGATGPYFPQLKASQPMAFRPQSLPAVTVAPVYGGSYAEDPVGSPADDLGQTSPVNSNAAPPVVINQTLGPPAGAPNTGDFSAGNGAQACANQPGNSRLQASDIDRPTIYLIAFIDHSIVQALGYWMEAGTLHYVTADYSVNQASVVLIDGNLSQRLNEERGIAFKLPALK